MFRKTSNLFYDFILLSSAFILFSCIIRKKAAKKNSIIAFNKKISYDDSTLSQSVTPYLLPYNRIIDGAGTVISFGGSELENHSLDAALLPDRRTLVVEDRYGVAFIDVTLKKLLHRLDYGTKNISANTMSVYSGIKAVEVNGKPHIFWSASDPSRKTSCVFEAEWDGKMATIINTFLFDALEPAPLALPNDITVEKEGKDNFLYVVLNGNSRLVKMRLRDKKVVWQTPTGMAPYGLTIVHQKAYVTAWAGPVPSDKINETAGVPYANVYINPATGATSRGTVSIIDINSGKPLKELEVGLHPNAIIKSNNGDFVYVANGNSDNVSVISTATDTVVATISVRLNGTADKFLGDSPNALALSEDDKTLYVANGLDNAIAVVAIYNSGTGTVKGFIPTQDYPSGIVVNGNEIYVTNLEGVGARVKYKNAFTAHRQEATVSIITIPNEKDLDAYTKKVKELNLLVRTELLKLLPRKNATAKPVPERIGEPSTIKHVIYIIKENRTYDQVFGDMSEGRGDRLLCVFGDSVTPNQHALARQYGLLDNYYASGKSSAEGHQWTDAAMVTDYVEKNVRAWFRSYPHIQQDALVYSDAGFLWNNALDHGKTVRIYGEACVPEYDPKLSWTAIYNLYLDKKPFIFKNVTTISRLVPILSQTYPGYDNHSINEQIRADAFIAEWKQYEKSAGDSLPDLIIVALPNDHTAGMRPGFPTPRAAVADNDLGLGRIIETVTHSRFWNSTAVFVTEDDSQDGWDHVSAYRTVGLVVSPYSKKGHIVHTNYNQTSVVRTIEQILGIPPMNKIDATATPMSDCFEMTANALSFTSLPNKIPLNEMNKALSQVSGREKKFTELSMQKQFDRIDGGNDDLMNRIIWFATMGKKKYPETMTLGKKDDD